MNRDISTNTIIFFKVIWYTLQSLSSSIDFCISIILETIRLIEAKLCSYLLYMVYYKHFFNLKSSRKKILQVQEQKSTLPVLKRLWLLVFSVTFSNSPACVLLFSVAAYIVTTILIERGKNWLVKPLALEGCLEILTLD